MAKPAAVILMVLAAPVAADADADAEAVEDAETAPASEEVEVTPVVPVALVMRVLLPAAVGYGAVELATTTGVVL